MSEKHTIRNTIFATVAAGLIVAVLLSAWFGGILQACFHWLLSVIRFMGSLLTHQIKIPLWALLILTILAILPIFRIVRTLRKKDSEPSEDTYIQDDLFGVVWRWCYSSNGIDDLWAFCPHCDNTLVYDEQRSDRRKPSRFYPPEFTKFVCENCDTKSQELLGNKSHALGRVEREIDRRLRTGEWKKSIRVESKPPKQD